MTAAGNALKELYLSLMHITCVAHLLHNSAMQVRAHFTRVNSLVASVKAPRWKIKINARTSVGPGYLHLLSQFSRDGRHGWALHFSTLSISLLCGLSSTIGKTTDYLWHVPRRPSITSFWWLTRSRLANTGLLLTTLSVSRHRISLSFRLIVT